MKSLDVLSNHVGGLPTQAAKALTHGLGATFSRFGHWNTTSIKTKGFIGNPPSLPACGSDPHTGFPTVVNNCKCPLCFEISHLTVCNNDSSEGINNFDCFISENKFRSNPNQKSESSQNETECEFKDNLNRVVNNKKTVNGEKYDEHNRHSSQNKVTSGSEDFMHIAIITEDSK